MLQLNLPLNHSSMPGLKMPSKKTAAARSKRELVLAATLELAAEKGVQATSTADIAAAANVGMGTIYRYFESKEILLTALFDELKNKFVEIIVSNYDTRLDMRENFKNIIVVLVKYYIEHEKEFKYLERYSDSQLRVGKGLDEFTGLVEHATSMVRGIRHKYKFKPLPPLVLFAMTYGPLVAVVNLVHMKKLQLTDRLLDEIAESCWHSILEG